VLAGSNHALADKTNDVLVVGLRLRPELSGRCDRAPVSTVSRLIDGQSRREHEVCEMGRPIFFRVGKKQREWV